MWLALPLAGATALLWLLRVGLQPWYHDAPLAGFARWTTAVFLAVLWAAVVLVPAFVLWLTRCD